MKRPLISVIIPVYNIEAYLGEAIDSVISQTVNFKNEIEVILVDDGSVDGSARVCQRYVDQYPENIHYIYQENSGVSKARNIGAEAARGEYIHFFDGDDSLSKGFYHQAIGFLQKHQEEADFVAVKIKFFDAIIDSHPLNYKFRKTRVIDLDVEPDNPILHVITCIFRAESIRDMKFDEELSVSEDVKYLNDILLKKRKYGVVTGPTYYYRKRSVSSSAIGGKEKNKSYYMTTPVRAYRHMLDSWRSTTSSLPIEYTLLYDISYRLEQQKETVLSKEERSAYVESIKSILRLIHDEVVINHRFLSVYKKLYILKLIHGDNLHHLLTHKDGIVYFQGKVLYNYRNASVHVDFFQPLKNGKYKIEGYIEGIVYGASQYKILVSGRADDVKIVPRVQREESFMGEIYNTGDAFEAIVEPVVNEPIRISVFMDGWKYTLPIHTGIFTRLATYLFAYRCDQAYLIQKSPYALTIKKRSWWRHILLELRQLVLIVMNWKLGTAAVQFGKTTSRNLKQLSPKAKLFEVLKPLLIVGEAVAMIPWAILLRVAYYISKGLKLRPLWIISDRGMAAGDNGEALFRYIQQQDNCSADVYFALSEQSKDYARLKDIGPVLSYGGLKYKLKFLLADKIISSHADIEVTNPFLRQVDHFVDLYDFDFVFLQHGVIRNDLSSWLNRFEKNISLFITSAKKEYDSILAYPYYYSEDNILLSGMPRYDYLNSNPKNKIIIAPTYRNNLLRLKTDKYGARQYDDQFKNSEYFQFYNRLINDEKIVAAMKKAGMSGELYIHPNFAAQTSDFSGNHRFTVMAYPYEYKKAISEGSLLVSDYSSIIFDFAYLSKPIIYSQFDVDAFFASQPYDEAEFFRDETDGFGPVLNDYDTTITNICSAIEQGCVMQDRYKKRASEFFEYQDMKNSQRVYKML